MRPSFKETAAGAIKRVKTDYSFNSDRISAKAYWKSQAEAQ